jgi:hypothetical protein
MESENSNDPRDSLKQSLDRPGDSLPDAIASLRQIFASHPGFMWTDSGFEVLHADWPAYPRGHGIATALTALAEYPRGTKFFPIDKIDQCTLFVIGDKPKENPLGSQHLHVAIWDDDLRGCASAQFVEGVRDEGKDEFLTFPDGFIQLAEKGVDVAIINALLGPAANSLQHEIIEHLYDARYHSAVREASLGVEIALRSASGLPDHGRRLVEKCFGEDGALVPKELTNASRQTLRNAFHGYFKYVRNEYAHNLPPVDMLTACTLVRRSAALLAAIHAMESARQE